MRFVLAHPKQLSEGKVWQCWVARPADDLLSPNLGGELVCLRRAALVAPDQRWTKNVAFVIEQHCSVHLARETDRGNLRSLGLRRGQHLLNGIARCAPPVVRILLGPTGLR